MKISEIQKRIILFLIISTVVVSINGQMYIGVKNEHVNQKLPSSGAWILPPLLIDDTDVNYNWGKTALENEWCSGSGTLNDPYTIENVIIDGQSSGNCIEIRNSNVFFTIMNCIVYNSGIYPYAGIFLYNTHNGTLLNNDCSYNTDGIALDLCINNTIIENNITNINDSGIRIRHSFDNKILGNAINSCSEYCIYLEDSWRTIVSGNLMENAGLGVQGDPEALVSNDIDSTNLVNGKKLYYLTNEISLSKENFTNAGQIILINCSNSLVSNLNITQTSIGIILYYCNNNQIMNNNFTGNKVYGIYLNNGVNNTISKNIASENRYGIYLMGWVHLDTCSNNNISGNIVNNNDCGIFLEACVNNTIMENEIIDNMEFGIFLDASSYTIVEHNLISGSNHGFFLTDTYSYTHNYFSNYNKFSYNNITGGHYKQSGISWDFGDFGIISNNFLNDSCFGIEIKHVINTTICNNVIRNSQMAILLKGDNNNIYGNNITNSNDYGIFLVGNENRIYSNIIISVAIGIELQAECCVDNYIFHNIINYTISCIVEYDQGNYIYDNECNKIPGQPEPESGGIIHGFNIILLVVLSCLFTITFARRKLNRIKMRGTFRIYT